jgi:hypothetical protein
VSDISRLASTVEALRQARAEKAKWADVENACVEKIKEALGDEPEGTIDGRVVITWKYSKPAETLDVKKLVAELPESVLAPYRMLKAPGRPFNVKDD